MNTDPATQQRHAALTDSVDMCRRAAAAALAAANSEPDDMRRAVLESAHDRLLSLLAQLQALI